MSLVLVSYDELLILMTVSPTVIGVGFMFGIAKQNQTRTPEPGTLGPLSYLAH